MTRPAQGTRAAIEGGGTTFRCALLRDGEPDEALSIGATIPTSSPGDTLPRVVEWFRGTGARIDAVGLACFGPLDVDPHSPTHGRLLATPKPGWSGFDVVGALRDGLGAPVSFHTDVVAAALGEWRHGAARGARSVLYLTVGTGVGGGALIDGIPIGGASHPEMGHVAVKRDRGDRFPGVCPFHGDCLEGLVSGPAIAKRTMRNAESVPLDHPAYQRAAGYLGQAVASLLLTLAPDVIVVGGGVTRGGALLPRIRARVVERLNGYLPKIATEQDAERVIVPPGLGDRSALIGAASLVSDPL